MSEKENNKEIENIETQISESSNKQETVEKEIIEDIKNEPVTEKENTDSSKITVSQPEEEEHSEILKETPNIDYSQLTELELISELKSIIHSKPVQQIKDTVENIKNAFNLKFQEGLEKNKESFLA